MAGNPFQAMLAAKAAANSKKPSGNDNSRAGAIARRLSSGKGKGNSPKGMKENSKAEEAAESPAFEKREDAGS